ncbi:MAG: Asp23/Gls24 family envelope stress response protein [Candidatus Dormibacteria bacterium]
MTTDTARNHSATKSTMHVPHGTVRVATDVIGWIAALAAVRVDGVHGLVRPHREGSDNILRMSHVHKGVVVKMLDERRLTLDVWCVMDARQSVHAVAKEVQHNVAEMVERMLNLQVVDVNVFVAHVAYSA